MKTKRRILSVNEQNSQLLQFMQRAVELKYLPSDEQTLYTFWFKEGVKSPVVIYIYYHLFLLKYHWKELDIEKV